MSTRAVSAATTAAAAGHSKKPLQGRTWSSSTAAAAAAELAADELDDKEFVSKQTLNRRQDKKLIDDITSVLYRLELDSVKPSEYVMELTGNHRRRQAAASARGKGSKSAASGTAAGAASKTAKTRQRPAVPTPVAEPEIVPDPDIIYTATGVKSLKKGKDAHEDQVSYYKTLLDDLHKHQTGRLRDDQKKKEKDESAALASYVTLPRSWRHFDEQQKAAAAAAAAAESDQHKRRPDERLITVSDLPYGDGSKQLRYATLDDIKSRHNAPTSTPSSYTSPRSWSMVDFLGGDEELLSYLYNEPETNAENEYRRDVIRPLERSAYRTSDYTEQLLGRPRSTLNGGYSSGLHEYSSSYRVPYNTSYIF